MPMNDRQLAECAQDGDAEAFAELVRRFVPRLFRHFVVLGLPAADAEDLVQETCLRAYRAIDRYDSTWAFSTWLFTIGRRLTANFLRDRRPVCALPDDAELPAAADPTPTDDDGIWLRARGLLPVPQFDCLWLFYGEGKSVQEISRILDCTAINVKVRLHRARRRLARLLREEGPAACTVVLGGER
jgi:RNA polymerase sigma-70 factor (ECF subfamily)